MSSDIKDFDMPTQCMVD